MFLRYPPALLLYYTQFYEKRWSKYTAVELDYMIDEKPKFRLRKTYFNGGVSYERGKLATVGWNWV